MIVFSTNVAKLNSVESDFKTDYLTLADIFNEEAQEGEQLILDKMDNKMASHTVRLQCLVSRSLTMATPSLFVESTLER